MAQAELATFYYGPADGLTVEIDEPHRRIDFAQGERSTVGHSDYGFLRGILWPLSSASYLRQTPKKATNGRVFYFWHPEKAR